MKTNLAITTIRHLLRIFARSLAILALALTAQASLIYTDFSIASGSTNVGTFSIAASSLYEVAQLSQSGSASFNYAYRVFTPSATGSYTLGMTTANYDPVMILYSGLTSFPANPATGAMALNDDGDWSQFSGRTPTPGDYETYMPLLLDQPMTAGTNYLVAISTYSPRQTVQLPASFFLAGPGAAGLDGAPATPATPALYWLGSAGDSWTAANNWSSNATGTPTGNFTASSDIVFSATGSSNETATNLGGDQTIASLTINTTAPVGISGGNLTVSGATTINNGTLTIGNGSTTGALIGDITNNSTLAFNRSDASTYSDTISGTGNVNKLGNGTLTLNASNTYTGTTTINAGTLQIGAGGTSGAISSSSNITNNANLVFNRSDATTYGGLISGTGNVTNSSTGTLTLSGNNTYTGGTTLAGGTLSLGSAFAIGTSGNISFSGGSLQFTANNTTDYSARFSQDVNQAYAIDTSDEYITLFSALTSDGGSLTKQGAGILVLTGTNTYTGNTSIISGTLVVSENSSLADSTNVSVATGATYQVDATDTIGSIAGNGTIILNGYSLTAGGSNSTTTFSGMMRDEPGYPGSFTKAGAGTLTLSGNNTYTGGTTITSGTLDLTGSLANSAVSIASGAGLNTSGGLSVNSTVANSGNFTVNAADTIGSLSGTGNTILNAELTTGALGNPGNPDQISGIISGNGAITFNSIPSANRASALTANNTYTGSTTVSNSTLILSGNGSIASSSALTLGANANLNINSVTASSSTVNNLSSLDSTAFIELGSNTLIDIATDNRTFSGTIGSANPGGFTKRGNGTLTLAGDITPAT